MRKPIAAGVHAAVLSALPVLALTSVADAAPYFEEVPTTYGVQGCSGTKTGCWTNNYLRMNDIDGDGNLDILFPNANGFFKKGAAQPFSVHLNDGTGVFTSGAEGRRRKRSSTPSRSRPSSSFGFMDREQQQSSSLSTPPRPRPAGVIEEGVEVVAKESPQNRLHPSGGAIRSLWQSSRARDRRMLVDVAAAPASMGGTRR